MRAFLVFVLTLFIFFTILTILTIFNDEGYQLPLSSVLKEKKNITINPSVPIHYVFWTGGYDSTFIVLYYLYQTYSNSNKYNKNNKDILIQPIYLSGCVDNMVCHSDDSRQSKKYEMETMEKIRSRIPEELRKRLLPTIVISDIKIDDDIDAKAKALFRVGHSTRPRNQYASIAQVCKNRSIVGAVGVVRDDDHDNWGKIVGNVKNKNTSDAQFDYNHKDIKDMKEYSIFSEFRFPTIFLTKQEMMDIAKRYHFDSILSLSWSCWFPEEGKPCGKCNMCKTRIIK